MSTKTLNKQTRFNELKQLYIAYTKDRNSVNLDWQELFDDLTPNASLFLKDFYKYLIRMLFYFLLRFFLKHH